MKMNLRLTGTTFPFSQRGNEGDLPCHPGSLRSLILPSPPFAKGGVGISEVGRHG